MPPGRRITGTLANWRGSVHIGWVDGEPPEPDWTILDRLGNYLHQQYDQEAQDRVIELDCRLEGLNLTEEQIHMGRAPELRLDELPAVQESVTMRFTAAVKRQAWRRSRKTQGRWTATLSNRKTAKASKKWIARLAKGTNESFKLETVPKAVGAKGRLPKSRTHKARNSSFRTRNARNSTAGTKDSKTTDSKPTDSKTTAATRVKIVWEACPDDPYMGQKVRFIGLSTLPDLLGTTGEVHLVQNRKTPDSVVQVVSVQYVLRAGKLALAHVPKEELQLLTEGEIEMKIQPFRLNYTGFHKSVKTIQKDVNSGDDAKDLELAQHGHCFELGMSRGLSKGIAKVRKCHALPCLAMQCYAVPCHAIRGSAH